MGISLGCEAGLIKYPTREQLIINEPAKLIGVSQLMDMRSSEARSVRGSGARGYDSKKLPPMIHHTQTTLKYYAVYYTRRYLSTKKFRMS